MESITKLNGKNYMTWKFQTKIILKAKKVWEVVEDKNLERGEREKSWEEKDNLAQEIIITRLEENVLSHLITCKTSSEIWNKISCLYEPSTKISTHLLQQKFFNLKFEEPMSTFFSNIESVTHQLRSAGENISEKMIMTKIIMALPEKYTYFISAWESVPEEKQTVEELQARLLMEEERTQSKEEESKAFILKTNREKSRGKGNFTFRERGEHQGRTNQAAGYQQQYVQGDRSKIKCFECGKIGHIKKECRNIKCHYCDRVGHVIKDCRVRMQKEKVNKRMDNYSSNKPKAFVMMNNFEEGDIWIMDTGTTNHVTGKKDYFVDYKQFSENKYVIVGDGRKLKVEGTGKIELFAKIDSNFHPIILHNVYYVPDIKVNLFSVSRALDKGYTMISTSSQCKFLQNEEVTATADRVDNLYVMNFCVKQDMALSLMSWHQRLGHQNFNYIKQILRDNNIKYESEKEECIDCIKGKQYRLPFIQSESRASVPGQLIHMDLCGPMEEESLGGSKYFLLFKDDFSSFRFVYFLRNKFNVKKCIEEFIINFENQTGYLVKIMRSDNGSEFINKDVTEFFKKKGIIHQTTVAYTPEQNGRIEREMRTVVESARTMLIQAGLGKQLWAEATATAVYVINRTGKSKENHKTPYQLLYKKDFDINTLKIFGTEVYMHVPKQKRAKWDEKGKKGIFVGYGVNTKGYRVWIPNTKIVETVRDVIFLKGNKNLTEDLQDEERSLYKMRDYSQEEIEEENEEVIEETTESIRHEASEEECELENKQPVMREQIEDISMREEIQTENEENKSEQSDILKKRSQRKRKEPVWSKDYQLITYEEALKSEDKDKWTAAIAKELETLIKNNTWTKVDKVPKGSEIISSKWVLKIKEDGQYKARLVARGFEQSSVDDIEVYAPVAGLTTFRTFLAVATEQKKIVHQLDVTGAFLYGDIKETVYMKLPDETVVKLNKSIYGLKTSPRYWNEKFNKLMESEKFIKSKNDPCLYSKKVKGEVLYVLLFVDDVLCFGADKSVEKFKELLKINFEIKDLGVAKNYLGISISQDIEKGVTRISQEKYLERVLEKYGMANCKSISTPIDQNFNFKLLEREKSESAEIEKKCRMLIGSLLYACQATRPDLCVAVTFLSRYQHCASELLYKCLKRVLRYIKGTLSLSLEFHCEGNAILKGYADSDWAGDVRDRKSTSAYTFQVFDNLVSWQTKKQTSVTLSSAESEYMALSVAITEGCWLKMLLKDFGYDFQIIIYEDNQSVIKIAENNDSNRKLKHIDIRYHYIVENVTNGLVKLKYIKSSDNIADLFTKPLGKQLFEKHRNLILV